MISFLFNKGVGGVTHKKVAVVDVNAPAKPTPEVVTLYTSSNPVEKFCAVGDPLIIEWKGARYPTLMRGAKAEVIATNTSGGRGRISIIPERSFIIVDTPKGHAAAGFINNASLTLRFLCNGAVYAITAKMIRVHGQPSVLVLEYPEKMRRYDLRSGERVSIISRALVSKDGGSTHQLGAVLDISTSGARLGLEAVDGIDRGMTLHLSFMLPNGIGVTQLSMEVRNISEENGKYLLGVRLLGRDPAVDGFCRNCLQYLE